MNDFLQEIKKPKPQGVDEAKSDDEAKEFEENLTGKLNTYKALLIRVHERKMKMQDMNQHKGNPTKSWKRILRMEKKLGKHIDIVQSLGAVDRD